jgi:hypothetical protein
MVYGYCRLTRNVNQKCGDDENLPFRDLIWLLGFKEITIYKNITLHVALAILFLGIGIYKYVYM